VAKQSAVNEAGSLRQDPIDGLAVRPIRPVAHEDGFVTEVAREVWPEIDRPIVQVHVTMTFPDRIRARGMHEASTDRLCGAGPRRNRRVRRPRGSPSFGQLNEFRLSERNPGLVVIPPMLYHGWKNIGVTEAFIVNTPSNQYHHEGPDALDLPYDSPEAKEIVPFRW